MHNILMKVTVLKYYCVVDCLTILNNVFDHYTRGIFIKSKRGREYVDYLDGSKKKKK